ncbi:YdcF family protein [Clostridium bovifaecis]|uniref:YdcF family protein n=1 Tax=Clostridium bovifaecis TaxID=2184719 RepID=A0A6I6EQ77_9CLOT|nr:YdcF family protein [Clostridium bovifaecis]
MFLLGLLSLLYYVVLSFFSSRISFSLFWIALGLMFISLGLVMEFGKRNIVHINKNVKIVFLICFIAGCISFIIIESFIIYYGYKRQMRESDYLLILGAGLHGERMSLTLSQRMDRSLEYLKMYPSTKIIVSGGQGPGEDITEAEAMERFLISNGIDKNQIIKEERSTSTSENFKYSREVLNRIDKRNELKVAVVTTNFHMFRAKFLGERAGFNNIYTVPSKLHIVLVPNYYVREYLAVINSFIFDK